MLIKVQHMSRFQEAVGLMGETVVRVKDREVG